jgi:hypothetical protein
MCIKGGLSGVAQVLLLLSMVEMFAVQTKKHPPASPSYLTTLKNFDKIYSSILNVRSAELLQGGSRICDGLMEEVMSPRGEREAVNEAGKSVVTKFNGDG